MLQLKANKKLVREQLEKESNKVITLKDLSNLEAKSKGQAPRNDIEKTVAMLQNDYNASVRLLVDEKDELRAMFFQDDAMKSSFAAYPEIIFIDATYKLLETRMACFLVLIEDGNGLSEIVAVGLFATEDGETLQWFFEAFKESNPSWASIRVTMADKDLKERQVVTQLLPQASLQICAFHTLQTFRREISIQKLGISRPVQETALDLLQSMVYSQSEEEYERLYRTFKLSAAPLIVQYFDSNWHNIHEEWIMGSKWSCGNFMNATNNRAESINGKLKSIVDRYSSLENFVRRFFSLVYSTRKEVMHKAVTMLQKRQVTSSTDEAHVRFSGHLTPYAFKHVERQLHLSTSATVKCVDGEMVQVVANHKLYHASVSDCSCGFRTAMLLPCCHIFTARHHFGLDKYDESLCSDRWSADTYARSVTMVLHHEQQETLHVEKKADGRILSSHQKFKKASVISAKLATLASEGSMAEFQKKTELLEDLLSNWMNGYDVQLLSCKSSEAGSADCTAENSTNNDPVTEICEATTDRNIGSAATVITDQGASVVDDNAQDNHLNLREPEEAIPCTSSTSALSSIKVPPAMRKCGRPKGHALTVVGLSKKRNRATGAQVPFKLLSMREKRKQILGWLVGQTAAKAAIDGKMLEENDVEQRPELIHCGILDENVDFNAVQRFFSEDAWLSVTSVIQHKQKLQKWDCHTCSSDLEGQDSIVCDWCLSWYHLTCVGLKKQPKTKVWQCLNCE